MKRTLALVLALLLLLPACSSNNPEEIAGETVSAEVSANEGTAEEAVPEETEYAPDLPDVKYDGEEFRVLYRTSSHSYAVDDVFVESDSTWTGWQYCMSTYYADLTVYGHSIRNVEMEAIPHNRMQLTPEDYYL